MPSLPDRAPRTTGMTPARRAWTKRVDGPRARAALRTGLASVATMVVAFTYDWPSPSLAMLAAVVVTRPDTHLSPARTPPLVGACFVGGLVGTLLLNLSQEPAACSLALGAWFTLCGALSLTRPLGVLFLVGAQVSALIFVLGFHAPTTAGDVAFARTAETLLGAGCGLLANVVVWPEAGRVGPTASGFSWRSLRLSGVQWLHGVKVAAALLLAIWLWFALDWPLGQTVVVSALLVSTGGLGASVRGAIQRGLGVVLSSLLALGMTVCVVPHLETIFGYGLLIFAGVFGFAYLTTGGPRWGGVGAVGTVAFVLTMVGGNAQSVALEPIRQRIVATALGVAVALAVFGALWAPSLYAAWRRATEIGASLRALGWPGRARPPRNAVITPRPIHP